MGKTLSDNVKIYLSEELFREKVLKRGPRELGRESVWMILSLRQ